jgi:hypothetical protein
MCAYCVDYEICSEYNPCNQEFVDLNISCQDVIVNSNITPYLETCGVMSIGDYCTIIFILLTILSIIYILISNKYIKNKHEELERPANVIFMSLCIFIILCLIAMFTLYRLVLGNVGTYYNNLYVVLKYLSILITVLLLLIIFGIILIIIIFSLGKCVITKTKNTAVGNYVEKITNKLPCVTVKRRSIFEDAYEDEYLSL